MGGWVGGSERRRWLAGAGWLALADWRWMAGAGWRWLALAARRRRRRLPSKGRMSAKEMGDERRGEERRHRTLLRRSSMGNSIASRAVTLVTKEASDEAVMSTDGKPAAAPAPVIRRPSLLVLRVLFSPQRILNQRKYKFILRVTDESVESL